MGSYFRKLGFGAGVGFTLIEVLVIISIVVILSLTAFTLNGHVIVDTALSVKTAEIADTLKLAQARSMARYKDSQWGVYFFQNPAGDDQFVIFKGASYAARDTSYDLATDLPSSLSFSALALQGGGSEVVFAKLTGKTGQYGTVTVADNDTGFAAVTVNPLGVVDF